ncbi:hypothetical protein GCM10009037_06950 [Halarchaeum grantii]|uniref:Uncharacterized protein n=1 Tax=Halarchaeum grantii TaxID=1193105 RepID=A0A830ESJ1_9EURY|nr:hypothetical protein [Halarchaeum grantii]GGL25940.1 hypothetical protein GCM10009037_06950 [Halarchaeum grantii]
MSADSESGSPFDAVDLETSRVYAHYSSNIDAGVSETGVFVTFDVNYPTVEALGIPEQTDYESTTKWIEASVVEDVDGLDALPEEDGRDSPAPCIGTLRYAPGTVVVDLDLTSEVER